MNFTQNDFFFHEIKATKQPVYQYVERKPFVTNMIKLKKGDMTYLFTDGYTDQYGGPSGKKYKYKPFKSFLATNGEKDLYQQMKIIDEEFINWMLEFEQVDEGYVMGIRI